MQLVQILLPLYDNQGRAFLNSLFSQVRDELIEHFGGVTAYTRSPASGVWQQEDGSTVRDEIVIFEVMADTLDESWWRYYRETLERRFQQEAIVVRSSTVKVL
jgi:hypothetical protein